MGREIKLDVFLGVSEAKATFLRTLDQPALANWLRIVLKDAGCPHPRGQSIELLYPDTVHFFWVVWEPNAIIRKVKNVFHDQLQEQWQWDHQITSIQVRKNASPLEFDRPPTPPPVFVPAPSNLPAKPPPLAGNASANGHQVDPTAGNLARRLSRPGPYPTSIQRTATAGATASPVVFAQHNNNRGSTDSAVSTSSIASSRENESPTAFTPVQTTMPMPTVSTSAPASSSSFTLALARAFAPAPAPPASAPPSSVPLLASAPLAPPQSAPAVASTPISPASLLGTMSSNATAPTIASPPVAAPLPLPTPATGAALLVVKARQRPLEQNLDLRSMPKCEEAIKAQLAAKDYPSPLSTIFAVYMEKVNEILSGSRQKHRTELESQAETHRAELECQAKMHRVELETRTSAYEAELQRKDVEHKQAIEATGARVRNQLEAKQAEHDAALKEMQRLHEQNLALVKEHVVQQLETAHVQQREEWEVKARAELEQIKSSCRQQLEQKDSAHESELNQLIDSHRDKLNELYEELDHQSSECIDVKRTLEDFKREYRAPFVVPALFDVFQEISQMTNGIMQREEEEEDSTGLRDWDD